MDTQGTGNENTQTNTDKQVDKNGVKRMFTVVFEQFLIHLFLHRLNNRLVNGSWGFGGNNHGNRSGDNYGVGHLLSRVDDLQTIKSNDQEYYEEYPGADGNTESFLGLVFFGGHI